MRRFIGNKYCPETEQKYYWLEIRFCYARGMENQIANQIVKFQPGRLAKIHVAPDPEKLIAAYWLMFCRAPGKANPHPDGSYWLGEVGTDREKNWERLTPYSLARPNV